VGRVNLGEEVSKAGGANAATGEEEAVQVSREGGGKGGREAG